MKESALTQQSDCKWVRALDSNGNSILISKEDLASVVGELLPITYQKNETSGGKKILIDIPSSNQQSITILLTIEGVNSTAALYLIHAITSYEPLYSVEKLNSDTIINSFVKFYIDKSSGIKLYVEREGCVFNVTILQGSINYIPLKDVDSIPSSAEQIL